MAGNESVRAKTSWPQRNILVVHLIGRVNRLAPLIGRIKSNFNDTFAHAFILLAVLLSSDFAYGIFPAK